MVNFKVPPFIHLPNNTSVRKGERTSVRLDARIMICPLPPLLPSISVNPIARHRRSLSSTVVPTLDVLLCRRLYIELLISLRLSLPWGASKCD